MENKLLIICFFIAILWIGNCIQHIWIKSLSEEIEEIKKILEKEEQ